MLYKQQLAITIIYTLRIEKYLNDYYSYPFVGLNLPIQFIRMNYFGEDWRNFGEIE